MRAYFQTIGFATALLIAGCSPPGGSAECGESDGENDFAAAGFQVKGFSLGDTGRGYLSANGSVWGVFAVDVNTKTAQRVDLDYFAVGKVVASKDGDSAIVMVERDPFGPVGFAPSAIVRIDGTSATLEKIGEPVQDVQRAGDGWLVSAGDAGAFYVDASGGPTQTLPVAESKCAAEAAGRWLVCSGTGVEVLTTAGTLVSTLPMPAPPQGIGGDAGTALVLAGTSINVVQGDAVQATLPLEDRGLAAWVSGEYGFVTGYSVGAFVQIAGSEVSAFDPFDDVALGTDTAFIPSENGILAVIELDPLASEIVHAPVGAADLAQIEVLPDGRYALALSRQGDFCKGDFVTVFATFDPTTSGWTDFWGVEIE